MGGKKGKVATFVKLYEKMTGTTRSHSPPSDPATDRSQRRCSGDEATEQCPLTANPSILLNVLCYDLDPRDLAALEVSLCNLTSHTFSEF